MLLRADVLGHRLIDVETAHLVRAADLELAQPDGEWVLAGVDTRRRPRRPAGAVRARRAGSRRQEHGGHAFRDWSRFEPLIGHAGSAGLRGPFARIRRLKPAQIADLLEEASKDEETEILGQVHADPELEADVFEELDEDRASRLLAARSDAEIAEVLARMRADDAADAIAELPQSRRQPVLDLLPPGQRTKVLTLMGFNPTSAGGLMGVDFLALAATRGRRGAGRRRPRGEPPARGADQRARGGGGRAAARRGQRGPADAGGPGGPRSRDLRQRPGAGRAGHRRGGRRRADERLQPDHDPGRGRGPPHDRPDHRGRRAGGDAAGGLAPAGGRAAAGRAPGRARDGAAGRAVPGPGAAGSAAPAAGPARGWHRPSRRGRRAARRPGRQARGAAAAPPAPGWRPPGPNHRAQPHPAPAWPGRARCWTRRTWATSRARWAGSGSARTTGRGLRRRLITFLAIMGPGLIVMVGDNDAGGVSTYAQAGQNYGYSLLWVLLLLIPVLIVNQEMVVRLGAVTGVGHARLINERFGRFWGWFSVGDLFLLNFLTIVTEFIGVSLALRYFGISPYISVPITAVVLVGITASGSFPAGNGPCSCSSRPAWCCSRWPCCPIRITGRSPTTWSCRASRVASARPPSC